jgi:O-antigen/teichoic acid export membrane protein
VQERSGSGSVARSSLLMFTANFAAFAGGALYWFILARVVGLHGLGVGSGVVSAAGVVASVLGAGFGLAFARWVAENPGDAPCCAVAGLVVAAAAGLLAGLLGLGLGGVFSASWALALGTVMVASGVAVQILVGLGGFRRLAVAQALGGVAKLSLGLALGLAGYGAVAVLAGYLAHPLVLLAAGLLYAGLSCSPRRAAGLIVGLAGLAGSNMLFAAGNQLVQSLGVYIYAVASGDTESTGVLYIGVMLAVVAAMPVGSLASAALHHGVREGREMAISLAPLGLLASTLTASGMAGAAGLLPALLGARLPAAALTAVRLLVVGGPLLGLLNAALSELNRRSDAKALARVSGARLAAAAILFPVLSRAWGLLGAAAAFLASQLAGAAAAALEDRRLGLLAAFSLLAASPGLLAPLGHWLLGAAAASLASAALGHLLLYPVPEAVRVVAAAIRGGGKK